MLWVWTGYFGALKDHMAGKVSIKSLSNCPSFMQPSIKGIRAICEEGKGCQLMAHWPLGPGDGRKGTARYPVKDSRTSLCKLICNQLRVITHCFLSVGTRNPWENNELQLMTIRNYCLMASLIAYCPTDAMNTPCHNAQRVHKHKIIYCALAAFP